MNKPAHFFDVNYTGSDVFVDGFAVRSKPQSQTLSKLEGYNNKHEVRAAFDIQQGQIVEECPFIVLHESKLSKEPQEAMIQMNTMFIVEDHSEFSKNNGPRLMIAGGNAPFYSHSFDPNAYVVYDHVGKIMTIKALKAIPAGHEIKLYRYGSFQVMKNNTEIQKFYAERQKQVQQNNVNTGGFRSMQSSEIKNIETVEVKSNDTV
jgi:hypothetical protein